MSKLANQWTALGDAHARHRDFDTAFGYHARAHKALLSQQPAPSAAAVALSLTTLTTDLLRTFRLDEALATVSQALELNDLPEAARRVLLHLEADVRECQGDHTIALLRFEQALAISPASTTYEQVRHLELLRSVRAGGVPASIARVMATQMQSRLRELEHRGCEGHWRGQLPKRCVPGLAAHPWHSAAAYGPRLVHLVTTLRAETAALSREYDGLWRSGRLRREDECIHEYRTSQRPFQSIKDQRDLSGLCRFVPDSSKFGAGVPMSGEGPPRARPFLGNKLSATAATNPF